MSNDDKREPLTDPATGHPLPQRVQPGYYKGWDVMRERSYWDAATRKVVEERLKAPPPLRFFSEAEAATMTAVLDRVLPQDDRLPAQRIPLLPVLDQRLHANRIEGYRFEDMPSDQQAYRSACEAFEAMGREVYELGFAQLTVTSQETLLQSLHDGEPVAAKALWQRMNVERFWSLLVTDACSAYYAHPWAWTEVGFGGPSYPRGYMRLEEGEAEPWEFEERRYAWAAPADTLSDRDQMKSVSEHQSHHGQAGTH
jgi:hypothetical protein